MRSRAFRRHHLDRAKTRARKKCIASGAPITDRRIGMMAITACLCSCHMCQSGNRRSQWASNELRLTMQERRNVDWEKLLQDALDELKNLTAEEFNELYMCNWYAEESNERSNG